MKTSVSPEQIQRIAALFRQYLREHIGDEKFNAVLTENVKHSDNACASHDYCDANEVMCRAFAEVMGRDPFSGCALENGEATEAEADADCYMLNAAWKAAELRKP